MEACGLCDCYPCQCGHKTVVHRAPKGLQVAVTLPRRLYVGFEPVGDVLVVRVGEVVVTIGPRNR
jgi:hypothetical protein